MAAACTQTGTGLSSWRLNAQIRLLLLLLQGKDASQLAPLYRRAHDAGLAALQQEVAAAAAAGGDDISSWGPLLEVLEPVKVRPHACDALMRALMRGAVGASAWLSVWLRGPLCCC